MKLKIRLLLVSALLAAAAATAVSSLSGHAIPSQTVSHRLRAR